MTEINNQAIYNAPSELRPVITGSWFLILLKIMIVTSNNFMGVRDGIQKGVGYTAPSVPTVNYNT